MQIPSLTALPDLPVRAVLPALAAALAEAPCAVLEAPPGAGKTTLAPIHLAAQPWATGRIVMLEPRRVAARAAAERIASLVGETPGASVGWRIRGENTCGPDTKIEVVTEGVLTRMLQSDPELSGVSALLFDEIHERSLNADLGLALALEAQGALREDLRIVAMSATLDADALAALMGNAPVIRSDGRMFPVETRHLVKPWRAPAGRRGPRFEDAMADLIAEVMAAEPGSALAFLPGAGEIARVEQRLSGRLPGVEIRPLHGGLPFAAQRAAIRASEGRKLVLATSIAETSLTIDGVRIVIDGGLARRARFDPASGMSRLVTDRVTKAEAEQRRGRAGRLEPGVCARLWTKGEEGGMAPAPRPEILEADLAALALELALWGAAPGDLSFPDQPPEAAFREAQALLRDLGALDAEGRATAHGKALARAPAHPRLAHMMLSAPAASRRDAARLAALLEDRDPLPREAPSDLSLRLSALAGGKRFASEHPYRADPGRLAAIREAAKRLERSAKGGGGPGDAESPGALLARAYPDRIALMRRNGEATRERPEARYLLSGGKGAALSGGDPLSSQRLLAVADTDGDPRQAKIRLAAPLDRAELEALYGDRLEEVRVCQWNSRTRSVEARIQRRLFALVLDDRRWPDAPPEARAAAMAEGVRELGLQCLPWTAAAMRLRARVDFGRRAGVKGLPDMSDDALLAELDAWLTPHLGTIRGAGELERLDLASLLSARLDWGASQALEAAAPSHFTAPTGSKVPVDYDRDPPAIAIRLQELFGLTEHPSVGPRRLPLLLDLLSPAGRPVQTTADLPGFWANSYADVRKDLRGRYPRHPWPEDPAAAEATRRAKPRGR
ncbi:ATP-dependent helicase HrpB [Rhodovulum sp. DZ06]|uniref:ATP-dependent helicase HrpB n=1 Tax=Rhodovulum sp. DZ06 TaxID=3425126 RepID=UPI003D3382EB